MTNIPHVAPYGMEKDLHLVMGLTFQCLFITSILPLRNMFILAIHTTYIRPLLQLPKLSHFRPQQIINTQLFFLHNSTISFFNFYPPLMFLVSRFRGPCCSNPLQHRKGPMKHTHFQLVFPLTTECSSQDSSEDPKEQPNSWTSFHFRDSRCLG